MTTSSGSTLCLPGGNCSCTDTILADASPIVTASLCNSQQVNQGGWESMCTVPVDSSGVYDSTAHYNSFTYCQLSCSDAGYPLEGWAEFCAPAPPPPGSNFSANAWEVVRDGDAASAGRAAVKWERRERVCVCVVL